MKPDPAIYEMAALSLGITPAEILMIGDSYRTDVEGPRLAGLQALHLDRRKDGGDLTTLDELLIHFA